jgi:hypothetical protein
MTSIEIGIGDAASDGSECQEGVEVQQTPVVPPSEPQQLRAATTLGCATNSFDPTFKKNINQLTKEESDNIIHNIGIGNIYQHFDVKEFKNGSKRIIKRKEPTVRSVALKNSERPSVDTNKVYLTDNQLLMEKIIKLNKKVDKLKSKHLEYEDLIYGESIYKPNLQSDTPQEPEQLPPETSTSPINENHDSPQEQKTKHVPKRIKKNWRDNIKYLP